MGTNPSFQNYQNYLKVAELLSLQQPLSRAHDETLFIIVHQVYELWFKCMLHELAHSSELLGADESDRAASTLKRTLKIVKVLVSQLDVIGLEAVRVCASGAAADGPGAIAESVVDAIDDRTAAVLMSSVLFQNGLIVDGLDEVAIACERVGASLLVDAYHSINVVPFSVSGMGLEQAFVVGGGYKYCQFGEGVCFLRIPAGCSMRPILTGWFSEFGELADNSGTGRVAYGDGPLRFAGSTYDPVGHYRARAVLGFFRAEGLDVPLLRAVSQAQLTRLAAGIDALDLDPAVLTWNRDLPLQRRGGFLALEAPRADELTARLRERGVFTDHRGPVLRLGPAPYVTDTQLDEAIGLIGETTAR